VRPPPNRGNLRRGFEVKLTSSPRVTPSMRSAQETLGLDELIVIHAGAESYPLAPRIRAVGQGLAAVDAQEIRRGVRELAVALDGAALSCSPI
jgi:hypothetical protein